MVYDEPSKSKIPHSPHTHNPPKFIDSPNHTPPLHSTLTYRMQHIYITAPTLNARTTHSYYLQHLYKCSLLHRKKVLRNHKT